MSDASVSAYYGKTFEPRPIAWPIPRVQMQIGDRLSMDHFGALISVSVPRINCALPRSKMTISRPAMAPVWRRYARASEILATAMRRADRLRQAGV
jgi:hypothetical protein